MTSGVLSPCFAVRLLHVQTTTILGIIGGPQYKLSWGSNLCVYRFVTTSVWHETHHGSLHKIFVHAVKMDVIKIRHFYLKHFSIFWIFNDIRREIISDCAVWLALIWITNIKANDAFKTTENLLTYSLTHSLTHSMVRDIIWKPDSHSACQTIAYFLYGARRFITVLTKARHWTLS